jgi:trk system potassium uptake protein TrkA
MLNPELITAHEINRILMTPAALNVEDFAHGKVRLFETKVRHHSKLLGVPLKEMRFPKGVLAGMIFRDHRMIIPHGDDSFMVHDNAYFIGMPEEIEKFSKNFVQRDARKLERAMIIGAGRTGRALAKLLDAQKVKVKVIDRDQERCRLMAEQLTDGLAICGDGTDIDLLTEEGVENADVVICLTEDDKLNLMLALLAKHLKAKKTVVRVARNEYVDLMEKVGVDVVVSARLLSASEVMAFARRGGVVSVSYLEGAKAEAMEVIVQDGAPVAHKRLMDAKLPRECLVCAYVRDGAAAIPNGLTELLPGDRTILFIQTKFAQKVMKYFQGR